MPDCICPSSDGGALLRSVPVVSLWHGSKHVYRTVNDGTATGAAQNAAPICRETRPSMSAIWSAFGSAGRRQWARAGVRGRGSREHTTHPGSSRQARPEWAPFSGQPHRSGGRRSTAISRHWRNCRSRAGCWRRRNLTPAAGFPGSLLQCPLPASARTDSINRSVSCRYDTVGSAPGGATLPPRSNTSCRPSLMVSTAVGSVDNDVSIGP